MNHSNSRHYEVFILLFLLAYEHRTVDGSLDLVKLVSLPCDTSFQCFEPLEEYRAACPQMLVVCRNAHSHPIPLPIKTPPAIRREVFDLLSTIEQDLADITPQQFLRHPVTRAYPPSRILVLRTYIFPSQIVTTSRHTFRRFREIVFHSELVGKVCNIVSPSPVP